MIKVKDTTGSLFNSNHDTECCTNDPWVNDYWSKINLFFFLVKIKKKGDGTSRFIIAMLLLCKFEYNCPGAWCKQIFIKFNAVSVEWGISRSHHICNIVLGIYMATVRYHFCCCTPQCQDIMKNNILIDILVSAGQHDVMIQGQFTLALSLSHKPCLNLLKYRKSQYRKI